MIGFEPSGEPSPPGRGRLPVLPIEIEPHVYLYTRPPDLGMLRRSNMADDIAHLAFRTLPDLPRVKVGLEAASGLHFVVVRTPEGYRPPPGAEARFMENCPSPERRAAFILGDQPLGEFLRTFRDCGT